MSADHPVAGFFGWMLTILGGLWVLLTGGCTVTMIVAMAAEFARGGADGLQIVGLYLAIGAVCMAPGAGLLVWGLALLRRSRRSG